ncbi:hypothetical protein GGE07_006319 [Sinorhizobium terangae]|uniref:Uncharacterized protein n=1 Tax=Sinorhizobium terangae TaxID=110322 RepID=A0A6N7L6W7_SINTE|nr:hypothetical protein [Sinorhizobium terangae]MBB4189623.1 hypothetical protein [Sinorhizobium terangae]MQX13442.1 hypothetical protein [Sinorhizobium terangae]
MKTPWKFLVQLSSRRRPAKVQENSIAHDTDLEAREREAEDMPALPFDNPTEASSAPDPDAGVSVDQVSMLSDEPKNDPNLARAMSLPIDVQDANTPAPSETNHSGVEADALGLKSETSTKPQRKPPIKHRERPKRARAQVAARSSFVTNEAQSVQRPSSGDPFFNEVVILDEEIKELRRLLAEKLRLQNVQLKKMLERFDVS